MLEVVKSLRMLLHHPLSRGRFSAIAFQAARWQFASKVLRREIVYDWVDGTKFYVRSGERGLTGNIYTGLLEFADMMFVLHFLSPGDVFADLGANSGAYTILASGAKRARSYAFEPVPSTYERLVRNLALNGIEGLATPIRKAVGDRVGQIHFSSQFDAMNRVTDAGSPDAIAVDVTTLDEVFRDEVPTLIKIDVEGYEEAVLRGGDRVLRNLGVQAIIAEINEAAHLYNFQESEVLRLLADHGFSPCSYEPFRRRLEPLPGLSRTENNTIFVRDIAAAGRKVAGSPPVRVAGRLI